MLTIDTGIIVHVRFILFTFSCRWASVLRQNVSQLSVELQRSCLGETVPQNYADNGVWSVAGVALVVPVNNQKELLLRASPHHPLRRRTALRRLGFVTGVLNLKEKE